MKTNYKETLGTFVSQRLYYKSIEEKDSDLLVKWRSDPQIYQYFENNLPVTLDSHLSWYHEIYLYDTNRADYMIYLSDTMIPIGICNISIDLSLNKTAFVGYAIGEAEYQGLGLASEALIALMDLYFYEADIIHFIAKIHKNNTSSINMVSKLGYILINGENDFLIYRYDKVSE